MIDHAGKKAERFPLPTCQAPATPLDPTAGRANARLETFAAVTPGVEYFDVTRYLCPDGLCSAIGSDGTRLYYDTGHLGMEASWDLGDRVFQTEGIPEPFTRIQRVASSHIPPTSGAVDPVYRIAPTLPAVTSGPDLD